MRDVSSNVGRELFVQTAIRIHCWGHSAGICLKLVTASFQLRGNAGRLVKGAGTKQHIRIQGQFLPSKSQQVHVSRNNFVQEKLSLKPKLKVFSRQIDIKCCHIKHMILNPLWIYQLTYSPHYAFGKYMQFISVDSNKDTNKLTESIQSPLYCRDIQSTGHLYTKINLSN